MPRVPRIGFTMTPLSAAGPPASAMTMCAVSSQITSSPGRQCTWIAISLHIVPEGRNTALSLPKSSATISQSLMTVGSWSFCSSPTAAAIMNRRISAVGLVLLSLKRSMSFVGIMSSGLGAGKGSAGLRFPFALCHSLAEESSAAFDAAGGEAADDLALDDHREDQHGQRHQQGRRGERAPGDLLEGEHVVDRDRQGPGLAARQHHAEDEIVPGEDESEDRRHHDAGPRERQSDVPERLPERGAVDQRGFQIG